MKAKAEAVNLRFMNWWLMGARHMVNNVRPINTVDDMAGLKMRVISSAVYIEAFRALGRTRWCWTRPKFIWACSRRWWTGWNIRCRT